MRPYFEDDWVTIYHGDCLDVMRGMAAEDVDAIVTDPPYGLSFMGREWDHGVPGTPFWAEALRVAKPGAHLVAFGGTRTYHRLACAIEDAGWEVRDCLGWLYGSGFPKSLDVSKAIDKEAGVERPVVGRHPSPAKSIYSQATATLPAEVPVTEAATEAAAAWSGWGTALKPAWEPCILARKPLTGTVAGNVQQWGTGAINIDGCRIGDEVRTNQPGSTRPRTSMGDGWREDAEPTTAIGRWPANIVHDGSDEVLAVFPQTGPSFTAAPFIGTTPNSGYCGALDGPRPPRGYVDDGSAARFFYCAKADKRERDEGLFAFDEQEAGIKNGSGRGYSERDPYAKIMRRNTHPTVKPLDLMRWLVRLVTPPDGVVLDPFMGSGTTLKAARAEGHRSIGIEMEAEYCATARGRLAQGVLL